MGIDDFELDLGRRELRTADGDLRPVEPKVFDVIALLAAHPHRVVTKVELLDEVWGGQFVSEWALSTTIKEARRALGDDGRAPRVIKTVHGRGYRMVAHVAHESPPPARSPLAPGRTNLPGGRCALIGRDADLERLLAFVEPGSIVSVVGAGGVGKTTLALAAGRQLLDRGADGVWFCDLTRATDHGVASVVFGSLSGSAGAADVSVDRLAELLGPRAGVLVLDNCEHVVHEARALLEDLLQRSPGLAALATSRESLQCLGERVVHLDGLDAAGQESPGVEMFMRRAAEVAELVDDADSRAVARQIVQRLDGLPLAIELAVPRLTSCTPTELLRQLDDQLTVLTSSRAGDRHATMSDAIAWSFDLLTTGEQHLLSELSVFRSPFRLEAATDVVGTGPVAETLHRLVRASMLTSVRGPLGTRFRMLEPIRQFVAQRLDPVCLDPLRSRHAEHFAERVVALARALHTSDEPVAAAALTAEWPDVAEAVHWGLALGRPEIAVEPLVRLGFDIRWQQRSEAYGWLEVALDRLDLEPDLRREALVVVGLGAWTDGDLDRLATLHARAREIGPTGVRGAMLDLFADFYSDDPATMVARSAAFRRAAEAGDDPTWIEVSAAFQLTAAALASPDGDETVRVAESLARLSRGSLWPSGRSWRMLSELTWAVRRGRAATAERIAEELAVEAAANGTPFFVQTAGPLLGGLEQGSVEQRLDSAADGVRLIAETGEQINYSLAFRSAVIALHAAGHLATAVTVAGFVESLDGAGYMIEVMTAEYDDVVDDLEHSLGHEEFTRLAGRGHRLSAPAAAQLVVERAAGA